ncbi:MAG: hypothetical protein NZX77_16015, partial [Polyangiaceae bacterium]|nr:hypothetical protein [Polyangiaceae bacterium]
MALAALRRATIKGEQRGASEGSLGVVAVVAVASVVMVAVAAASAVVDSVVVEREEVSARILLRRAVLAAGQRELPAGTQPKGHAHR